MSSSSCLEVASYAFCELSFTLRVAQFHVMLPKQWPTCMIRSRDTAGGQAPWNSGIAIENVWRLQTARYKGSCSS